MLRINHDAETAGTPPLYTLKEWKSTIDRLVDETGISLREVCDYMGSAFNEDGVSFYVKLPRRRSSFIGIGMAFGQPLEVINEWIVGYGRKRKLYVRDISEDLVWIYLINANYEDRSSGINYYRRYEEYQAVAHAVFREKWDEVIATAEDTADVEISLGQADYGPEYDGIKAFVAAHMDAFKTAYNKPRRFLDMYVDRILRTCKYHPGLSSLKSLNSLRGYLDDSMINFLSGDSERINVIDRVSGKRTINIKYIPKGRNKFIELGVSLGMTAEDINRLLDLMGYGPLDTANKGESTLISRLADWESKHPIQRKFKNKYFYGASDTELTRAEECEAVDEMLTLRAELIDQYRKDGAEPDYLRR